MSMMFDLVFAAAGGLAVAAILISLRHALPRVASLRDGIRHAPASDELRLTLHEHRILARASSRPLRHNHRPKPVTHRLGGHWPRRAAG